MSDVPSYSHLVCSLDEIKDCADTFVHIAIKRSLGYYHHILVNNWQKAKKTIFEYSVSILNLLFKQGEVIEKDFSEKELKKDILAKNVYIIRAPDYPKTPQEIWNALKRFARRLKEKAYALASNNCEHLINYVLTGKPKSEQINEAGAMKKFVIDTIDHWLVRGKWNGLKMLGSLLACIPVNGFIEAAVQAVLKEATKSALRVGAPVINGTVSCAARNLCKYASKRIGCKPSFLLNSKPCVSVAEEASKKALKQTAGATFLVTGTVEVLCTSWELWTLKKQKDDGHITSDDYDREWYKKISGSVGATVGSVGLGVLGQALCPVPLLGYALGNAVGNFCGRWLTSAFAGYCFDRSRQ